MVHLASIHNTKFQVIKYNYSNNTINSIDIVSPERLTPKYLRVLIIIALFLGTVLNTLGQHTISLKILDKSNSPLEFATITLLKDSSIVNTVVSDKNGTCTFTNVEKGVYLIGLSYLKFNEKNIQFILSSDTLITFQLTSSSVNLKGVTVVSRKPIIERKGDRFVFTPSKILADGASALELMRNAPLVKYNESNDVFSIIGKSNTVVYINNKKTTMPNDAILALLRSLPAENIKNIEIITNPGSEYAASITGGIININIRRQLYEGWLGNLALQSVQAVYNTTILNGYVYYRKSKIGLQFIPLVNTSFNFKTSENALGYQGSDLFNKIHSRIFRRYNVIGGGLNIDYNINKRNFMSYNGWFSSVTGKSNTEVFTRFYKADHPALFDSIYSSPNTGKDTYTYNFGNFNYHYNIDELGNSSLDFNIDYNVFSQLQKNEGTFNKLSSTGEVEKQLSKYENNLPQKFFNLSERIEYSKLLQKGTRLTIGVQQSNTKVDNDLRYYYQNQGTYVIDNNLSNDYYFVENYWAGFLSISKPFNKKWSSSLGLRLEGTDYSTQKRNLGIKNDSSYTNFFPSLSISYSPNQKHQFGFSSSRKIIRPSWELLFPGRVYVNANYFNENNPFLQPALFYSNELSYTFNNKHSIILNYSHIKNGYNNFILPVIEENITKLKSTYLNYGSVNSLTLTFNLNQTLCKGNYEMSFSPSFNYRYFDSDILTAFNNVRNFSFNAVFDNTIYLSKKKNLTAFATLTYTGARKDISSSVLTPVSSLVVIVKKVVKNFTYYLILDDVYNGSSKIKTQFQPNSLVAQNLLETNTYNRSISLKVRYKFGNNQLRTNKNRRSANNELRQRTKG